MTEAPIKRTQAEWDALFYRVAVDLEAMSKDPVRKVGALLVSADRRQMSPGYNGFPPEIPDLPSLLADRDFRIANTRHAEVNCLEQSPFPPADCTMYVTRFPCVTCASELRRSRIRRLVAPRPDLGHPRWGKSWAAALAALALAGIDITHTEEFQ